jgi:hypothetical protein
MAFIARVGIRSACSNKYRVRNLAVSKVLLLRGLCVYMVSFMKV